MKTMDLYFVEADEGEPIIYFAPDTNLTKIRNDWDTEAPLFHPEPEEAIGIFAVYALSQIAHLRAEADFLMDNLKSIQPMEDLK